MGADGHNGILMSLLFLVADAITYYENIYITFYVEVKTYSNLLTLLTHIGLLLESRRHLRLLIEYLLLHRSKDYQWLQISLNGTVSCIILKRFGG